MIGRDGGLRERRSSGIVLTRVGVRGAVLDHRIRIRLAGAFLAVRDRCLTVCLRGIPALVGYFCPFLNDRSFGY